MQGFFQCLLILYNLNLRSLRTFRTLSGGKRYLLAFSESFETATYDFGKMSKKISAAISRSDEPKAFCFVEPFYGTSSHLIVPLSMMSNAQESNENQKRALYD